MTVLAVMGLTREAKIVGRDGVRTVCGGGVSALLEERIERAIAEERPEGVISTGAAVQRGSVSQAASSVTTAEGMTPRPE